ncbi:hypothetical protein J3A83DRAFT_4089001 [Scleroderma citrinum]
MDFTNINDTAGVKALLERLKASQAWQETVHTTESTSASSTSTSSPGVVGSLHRPGVSPSLPSSINSTTIAGTPTGPSVASLLSLLKPSQWTPPASAPSVPSAPSAMTVISDQSYSQSSFSMSSRPAEAKQQSPQLSQSTNLPQLLATTTTRDEDVRNVTFQQALPRLTQLASNPEFIAAVARLRDEQKELERQLWEERCGIRRKHEERVKVARTKANMMGVELSKHEVDMLNDAFRRDTQKFDVDRVLIAWDALMEKQQTALETLGVPTMFRTGSQENYEKQKKVMQVLEGLIG